MALSSEDMRLAILDARERHKAQVDLMHANDRQALGILQLYVALAGASLSGAAVILLAGTNSLPRPVGFGLAGFSTTIVVGTVLTLLTMWPVDYRLPGRDPEFWRRADDADVTVEHAFRCCLDDTAESIAINRRVTAVIGRKMLASKFCGAAAPLIGLAAGLVALLARL